LIIVGSDQVWNSNITKQYLKDYLLEGIKCRKIAYAASLGSNDINEETKYLFKKLLSEFDFISLREEDSVSYLKSICGDNNNYFTCIDPVFLLNKNQWLDFTTKSKYDLQDNDYILIYMLEYNSNLIESAKILSKKYNMPIYSIEIPFVRIKKELINIRKLHDIGPIDFVKLFKNAKYILTNSFHGIAFSLIFNKKFASFAHSTLNLRIENLLKLYGLKDNQIINKNNIDIEDVFINCEKAYKNLIIYDEIKKSEEYIINSINNCNLKKESKANTYFG